MKSTSKFVLFLVLAAVLTGCAVVRDCDGNRYRTLKLNGKRWMAENLRTTRYADGQPVSRGDVMSADTTGAYYFDYGQNRDTIRKYGLLYNWMAAMRDTSTTQTHVQGVCPNGWHLPDDAEWKKLIEGCAALRRLSKTPTFNKNMRLIKRFAQPPRGGYLYPEDYAKVGKESYWWSSTPSDNGFATGRYLDDYSYPCPYVCFGKVYNGYSVRCVQDSAKIKTR